MLCCAAAEGGGRWTGSSPTVSFLILPVLLPVNTQDNCCLESWAALSLRLGYSALQKDGDESLGLRFISRYLQQLKEDYRAGVPLQVILAGMRV